MNCLTSSINVVCLCNKKDGMSELNKNAVIALQEIMQQRNWHNGLIERRKAAGYKIMATKDGLSYQKACEILELIGWKKVIEETWQKP